MEPPKNISRDMGGHPQPPQKSFLGVGGLAPDPPRKHLSHFSWFEIQFQILNFAEKGESPFSRIPKNQCFGVQGGGGSDPPRRDGRSQFLKRTVSLGYREGSWTRNFLVFLAMRVPHPQTKSLLGVRGWGVDSEPLTRFLGSSHGLRPPKIFLGTRGGSGFCRTLYFLLWGVRDG